MPSTTFNPFNPFSYWTMPFGGASSTGSTGTRKAEAPISITARASDPGIKVTKGSNSITLRGTTAGPRIDTSPMGMGAEWARSVSFTLDIEKAPTKDSFGRESFREKNSRLFTWDTNKGQSAMHVAQGLANKVNAGDDFNATVKRNADGSVTIKFTHQ